MYTVEFNNEIKTLMHPVKSAGTSIHAAIIEASNEYNYKVHVNQRHVGPTHLPPRFQSAPKYVVLREPHKWYRSFYRFFLGVEGYLSFMLNDPKEPYDGYIYPIPMDEFALRSLNFKDTLIKYPNKARVFRNLLRSQSHLHFITSYLKSDFHPDDLETMEQFNTTLYQWFHDNVIDQDTIFIPMNRLDIVEELFKIKIPHVNKTSDKKPKDEFSEGVLDKIKEGHKDWYNMIENFDENNLMSFKEYRKKYGS